MNYLSFISFQCGNLFLCVEEVFAINAGTVLHPEIAKAVTDR